MSLATAATEALGMLDTAIRERGFPSHEESRAIRELLAGGLGADEAQPVAVPDAAAGYVDPAIIYTPDGS